nr:YetF domain-containing protein [Bacillus sp. UNCCL81]
MGTFLLKIAGRNSISKLTISEIVLMSTIGPLLSRPIENKSIWTSVGVASILILIVIVFQFLKIKYKSIELLLTGRSIVIIDDGNLNLENMKKIRLTTENLIMRLHQLGKLQLKM